MLMQDEHTDEHMTDTMIADPPEPLALSAVGRPMRHGPPSRLAQAGHFLGHYVEMCLAMCIGFGVLDLVYFWAAGRFGYTQPFSQLPALSVLIVTFNMTAPMVVWMRFRGMAWRPIAEMATSMVILAITLLGVGWLGIAPKSSLAIWEHALMMPVMLIPMLFRLDLYTGRMEHDAHAA